MKKLFLLLGIMMVVLISGCGQSDPIEGTWVPKMPEELAITSVEFKKQNDFSYQGTVKYKDGTQYTSTFEYKKEGRLLRQDELDAKKAEKELNHRVTFWMVFNENFTEAKTDRSGTPKFIFVKQK